MSFNFFPLCRMLPAFLAPFARGFILLKFRGPATLGLTRTRRGPAQASCLHRLASIISARMHFLRRITPDRAVLLGASVAALAYLQDVRYDFIMDDVPLILLNETITSWRNWKSAFVTHVFSGQDSLAGGPGMIHYRPVFTLWQMLNEQLFGSVIPWWHISSLLLHVVATFLVYQLGVKLLKEPWTAALAALLFAAHPIHAESVAYVAASTDLLAAVFLLISFLAYSQYREQSASPAYFVASVFAAALAMLSKETAGMFPGMLVAYEAAREIPPSTRQNWKRFFWTAPFFAVAVAYVAARSLLFGASAPPGPGGSRLSTLADMPLVLLAYLRNFLWPPSLSFFYPAAWWSQWTFLEAAAIVVAASAAVVLWTRYRDRSGIRLQLLWAALLFVPPLLALFAFGREDWVHDRQMYLASIPICLIAAAILTDGAWPQKASIIASSAIFAALLIALAFTVPRFRDNNAIFASALEVAPRSLPLHIHYGTALAGYGRSEEACREFRIATELAPRSPNAHEWYGSTLADLGRDDEAMAEYRKAATLASQSAPLRAYILSRMAELELKHSEYPAAAAHLRDAVQLAPNAVSYHGLLAQVLSHEGLTTEAQEQTQLELSIQQELARQRRTPTH